MWSVLLAAATASESLPERWLLTETLAVEIKPPFKGWTRSETQATWAVSWTPGGDRMTARLCSLAVEPLFGVTTGWSPGLVERLSPRERPVRFDGRTFEVPIVRDSLGGVDDDGDGHPGVTVRVSIPVLGRGDLYLTQDAELSMVGELQPDGRVTGRTWWSARQHTWGVTRWWLERPLELRDANEPGTFELTPRPEGGCPAPTP